MVASSDERATYAATFYLWLGLSAVVACLGSHAAHAADLTLPLGATSPAPVAPVSWLFGDWDGARTRLLNAGVDFQFGYTSEIAGNATGGDRRQVAYTDQWTFGTTFDLTKLGVVPGGTVQVTWTDRNGSNLSDDAHLGTLQQVQEVFGRGQTLWLTILVRPEIHRRRDRLEDRADHVRRGLCSVLLRFPEPDILWRATGQPRRQLHLQLAGQPMGLQTEIQPAGLWLFSVRRV